MYGVSTADQTSHHSNPLRPRNNLFTCLTCQVAFPTTERQRAHYRTDWHKYNLKRKIAQLAPITAEQFAQKVLAQQTKGKEEEERQGLVYECVVCRKSYFSENAFANHLMSKKHKELEFNSDQEPLPSPIVSHKKEVTLFSDTEEETDNDSVVSSMADLQMSKERCLFCNMACGDFEDNLKHMSLVHGFFLPDREYLEDPAGLIVYLAEKIDDCICLYCNGRGREYRSPDAVRRHMLDKGHCKMAYDETEDPEDLLKFYNFGTMTEEDFEAAIVDTETTQDDELVLESGGRVGHRRFMRYYKQKLRRSSNDGQEEEGRLTALALTNGEGSANQDVTLEPRNRKERRSKLAITDGSANTQIDIMSRLPQAVRTDFQQRQASSKRSNRIATKHLRLQNPV